jgi:tRNA G37 N-methylase Trm5
MIVNTKFQYLKSVTNMFIYCRFIRIIRKHEFIVYYYIYHELVIKDFLYFEEINVMAEQLKNDITHNKQFRND